MATNCHWLFVLHELPLMYHKLSLIVLGGLYQGADGTSSHVIPTLACAVAWDLWLRPFSCFLLDKKALKNQGRHHRTQRTKRTLPRHVGRASAPYPVEVWRSHFLKAKQPCHASMDMCGGGHLWLRHTRIRPSQYENPTLHIGVW